MDKNFMNQVKNQIKEYLPKNFEDAEVGIEETIKNNDCIKQGLMVYRKGEYITPKIYLEGYEKRYKNGESLENLLREIADLRVLLDRGDKSIMSDLMDYTSLKKNLVFSMCDPEMNQRQFKYYVHTRRGRYATMYRLFLEQNENGTASMLITENHLKMWKITEEQLYEDTIKAENMRGFELKCMRDLLCEQRRTDDNTYLPIKAVNLLEVSEMKRRDNMYVLSNRIGNYGAGAIMHTEILEKIGNILESDFFILPSSIHELVITPDFGNLSQQELEEMVAEINTTQVEPEEIFSNHVSFYDNTQHLLLPEKPEQKWSEIPDMLGENLGYLPAPD